LNKKRWRRRKKNKTLEVIKETPVETKDIRLEK
jgi:hypothetical protein